MKTRNVLLTITLAAIFSVHVMAGSARAITSSSPEKPAGEAPYGLNVQGDASGTKLKGVLVISFGDIKCNPDFGLCVDIAGNPLPPNSASAKAAMRLSMPNTNKEVNTKSFYVNLGEVPYKDAYQVQEVAMSALRPFILEGLFGADDGQQIYLKEFNLYDMANIIEDPDNPFFDPNATNVEFIAIADITLAVN